jgi:hypothetical protein
LIDQGIVIYIVKYSMVHIIHALVRSTMYNTCLMNFILRIIAAVFLNSTDTSFLWTYDLYSPGNPLRGQVGEVGPWKSRLFWELLNGFEP